MYERNVDRFLIKNKHIDCLIFTGNVMLARYILSSCVRPFVSHTPALYQNMK